MKSVVRGYEDLKWKARPRGNGKDDFLLSLPIPRCYEGATFTKTAFRVDQSRKSA